MLTLELAQNVNGSLCSGNYAVRICAQSQAMADLYSLHNTLPTLSALTDTSCAQVSSPLSVQRYGMSDTDLSCAAARHAKTTSAEMCCITPGPGILPAFLLPRAPSGCQLLAAREMQVTSESVICLRERYAISDTKIAHSAPLSLHERYAMSGTDIAYHPRQCSDVRY
eukprot:3769658-Rhodomonas_salina.2